jgi:hypothetical protein
MAAPIVREQERLIDHLHDNLRDSRIETVRLRLRELQEADLCSLVATINNPRIARVPWLMMATGDAM